MNGLPVEMVDRWQDRAEPAANEGLIYWHMLVGADPAVHTLGHEAQRRLAQFPGLHLPPLKWLHMTALIAGPAAEISSEQITNMAAAGSRILAEVPPITVTIGKILYHSEAIMLAARPTEALVPVRDAAREATRQVTGSPGRSGSKLESWTPHITIACSTARQAAAPIIDALGISLPEREVTVGAVSLVNQRGAERNWDWHGLEVVRLGTGLNVAFGNGRHQSSLSNANFRRPRVTLREHSTHGGWSDNRWTVISAADSTPRPGRWVSTRSDNLQEVDLQGRYPM